MVLRRCDMEKQRLFIAMNIPPAIQEYIAEDIINQLKKIDIRVSWVPPENIHITMKFLGDVDLSSIPAIKQALRNGLKEIRIIESSIGPLSTFGGKTPRVVHISPYGGTEQIIAVASMVEDICVHLGFEKEKNVFKPHMTIGRVREPKNSNALINRINSLKYDNLSFYITSLSLMKSTLTPHGAIYEVLEQYDFID